MAQTTPTTSASTVETQHPDYVAKLPEWSKVRLAVEGEDAVKAVGEAYLPMPSGWKHAEDGGVVFYGAYKTRCTFPEITAPCVRGMTGVIHRTEIQVDLPAQLEPLWEKATKDGMSLEAVARQGASANRAVRDSGRRTVGKQSRQHAVPGALHG